MSSLSDEPDPVDDDVPHARSRPVPSAAVERHPSLDERHDPAIRIVEHDPAWATIAAEEIARLREVLGPVVAGLEHIGSTAVPGLAAKPIVDLQLAVAAIGPRAPHVEPLMGLGYLFAPDPGWPDHHFFALPPQRPRTHHLHVVLAASDDEHRHLAVRDYLRAHPEQAAAYGAAKRELAERHPGDRLRYIEGKGPLMRALEERALAWAARTIARTEP